MTQMNLLQKRCLINCGGDNLKCYFKMFKNMILNYIEDLLIISGLLIIVVATFFVSKIIGTYLLGIILLSLGILLSRHPPKYKGGE